MEKDLTVIYYTANRLRESFARNVRKILFKAIMDYPLISVSQKPLDFGQNICIGDIGQSQVNIYKQILIGAKAARSKYIALAEDDVLYSAAHFHEFRPDADRFAFNMSRWSIFTWKRPQMYGLTQRRTNTTMIAPRDLLIDALEERFNKYPDETKIPLKYFGEPTRYEKQLGVTQRKYQVFYSTVPVVVFSHPEAIGFESLGTRKRLSYIRALDIPYWGDAEGLAFKMYGKP